MSNHKRIGFDLDGVFMNWDTAWLMLAQRLYHLEVDVNRQASRWGWEQEVGITKDMRSHMWAEVDRSNFWATVPPYPGAAECLQWVQNETDHDVVFITAGHGRTVKWGKEESLKRMGLTLPTVVVTPNSGDKWMICKAMGITHFFDDKPENCELVFQHSRKTHVYVWDQPWNRVPMSRGIIRHPNDYGKLKEVLRG